MQRRWKTLWAIVCVVLRAQRKVRSWELSVLSGWVRMRERADRENRQR